MPRFSRSEGAMLHKQVSDYVREKIYSKEWGVDEPIPSEHELMDMLQLSRGTVQRGISQLVDEGLLVKQRGRGTFVTQPVMTRPFSNRLLSFGESMSAQGIDYVTRVVEHRIEKTSAVCAEHLNITQGDKHLYLVRVRYVRRLPVMLIESHLSLAACPGLDEVDLENEVLFAAVERLSGHGVGSSEVSYSARTVGKLRGEWLRCDEHSPVLVMDQLVCLDDGTPIEWGSVWMPANRCIISSQNHRE